MLTQEFITSVIAEAVSKILAEQGKEVKSQVPQTIPTKFDGYTFRSRLEARWAVFFRSMGIRYEYEIEGLTLADGNKYLPDFYLPDFSRYVEIKRLDLLGTAEGEKAERKIFSIDGIIAYGDPYDDKVFRLLPTENTKEAIRFARNIKDFKPFIRNLTQDIQGNYDVEDYLFFKQNARYARGFKF